MPATDGEATTALSPRWAATRWSGSHSTNVSVLRPYGVWLVISPFNFPAALTGGPAGAALVAGNTVVMKPATDTPWTARLIAECLRDAGLPDGVFNFVTGPGSTLGQALIDSPEVDGVTFTGSFDVGMKIYRDFADGRYVRPTILELGGKNPAIVSRHADLEDAATGIVRSAFGLQGQKCSACSRVFIEEPVYDELVERLVDADQQAGHRRSDRAQRLPGPGGQPRLLPRLPELQRRLAASTGRILTGGKVLTEGDFAKGYLLRADPGGRPARSTTACGSSEMFLPITTIAKVKNLDEAMRRANDVDYGLTAGFYGADEEVEWFFDKIEAGVTYANRPQGATTGAWPGFQPFGGWKGSGATGKNAGGVYYLPLYMHEQIRTLVRRA